MFEQNKAIARSVVEDGFNRGDASVLDAYCSPAFVNYSPVPGLTPDVEGWKNLMLVYRSAFPDLHLEIASIHKHLFAVPGQFAGEEVHGRRTDEAGHK